MTSMGAEAVLSQQLPGGTSQQHSEELLQQTAEAQGAGLRCVAPLASRSLSCLARLVYMHRCWQAQWLTKKNVTLAMCSFDGVYDVRPLLDAIARGRMAGPLQLSGVASTLEVTLLPTDQAAGHPALQLINTYQVD